MGAGAEDGAAPVAAGAEAVSVVEVVDSAEALVVAAASAAEAREVVGKGDINWGQIRSESTDIETTISICFDRIRVYR